MNSLWTKHKHSILATALLIVLSICWRSMGRAFQPSAPFGMDIFLGLSLTILIAFAAAIVTLLIYMLWDGLRSLIKKIWP